MKRITLFAATVAAALGVGAVFQNAHAEAADVRAKASGATFQKVSSNSPSLPPIPPLEIIGLKAALNETSVPQLTGLPDFKARFLNRFAAQTKDRDLVFFSVAPELQEITENLMTSSKAPHVAIVVMDPRSGRVLAIADKSTTIKNLSLHSHLPAASLFKIVTAAAALEKGAVSGSSLIRFRGGNYTLERWNYRPDKKRDRRVMSLAEAMGRSCNPVFGRIALNFLNPETIRTYANMFGFNSKLEFDIPLSLSRASIPNDDYLLSRTAAGFGEVLMSPVHAASVMAAIANDGLLPRPVLVDSIVSREGSVLYKAKPQYLRRVVKAPTARRLLEMMEKTTTIGTSRKEFMRSNKPILAGIDVAAKTGTLRGKNPKGINNWFIAAAPSKDPEIAIAVLVVNPGSISSRASHIGRRILEEYFKSETRNRYNT